MRGARNSLHGDIVVVPPRARQGGRCVETAALRVVRVDIRSLTAHRQSGFYLPSRGAGAPACEGGDARGNGSRRGTRAPAGDDLVRRLRRRACESELPADIARPLGPVARRLGRDHRLEHLRDDRRPAQQHLRRGGGDVPEALRRRRGVCPRGVEALHDVLRPDRGRRLLARLVGRPRAQLRHRRRPADRRVLVGRDLGHDAQRAHPRHRLRRQPGDLDRRRSSSSASGRPTCSACARRSGPAT